MLIFCREDSGAILPKKTDIDNKTYMNTELDHQSNKHIIRLVDSQRYYLFLYFLLLPWHFNFPAWDQ